MRLAVCLLLSLASFLTASAQIQIQIQRPEVNYLIYESIVVRMQIRNLSAHPILLQDVDSQSWLRFLVRRSNGLLVRPTQNFSQQSVTLQPGDVVRFGFDLTPYYGIREVGSYEVTALVRLPDSTGDLMSNPVGLNVVTGQKVWAEQIGMSDGSERRTYSLVNHLVDGRNMLYAQIESEDKNLVYTCRKLGTLMTGEKPQTEFEFGEAWHILFRLSPAVYRHYKLSLDGKILDTQDYAITDSRPTLIAQNGKFQVAGGLTAEQMRSETISGSQPAEAITPGWQAPPDATPPSEKKKDAK